jgi:hypothetical protein
MAPINPREQFAQQNAASKKVNLAWLLLIERVNQALDDGYDVLNPDVLGDALWHVAHAQIAAGRTDFVKQCEVQQYDAHRCDIDRRFPRRLGKAPG